MLTFHEYLKSLPREERLQLIVESLKEMKTASDQHLARMAKKPDLRLVVVNKD